MQTDGGTKPAVDNRFITGLSAVYQPDEKRSFALAADQWTEAFLSLKILFMQGMSGNFRSRARSVSRDITKAPIPGSSRKLINQLKICSMWRLLYLSNPKPGHTTGRSGRGGARRGGEGGGAR